MALRFDRDLSRDIVAISTSPKPRKQKAPRTRVKGARPLAQDGDIPTSDTLSGIELRVQKLLVRDNGTTWIWPFVRYSDLYVILVAIDDLGGDPYKVDLQGFADVDDGEVLPLERTAYLWQKSATATTAPNQVHVVISVVKSNSGIRKTGAALTRLRGSDDYQVVVAKLVAAVASSGATAIADGLLALTGVVGSILGDVEDRPLLTQVLSFTGINGDFDSLGKHVHERGNRFIDLQVALTVRDKNRDPQG
jgi:hypothetical protein